MKSGLCAISFVLSFWLSAQIKFDVKVPDKKLKKVEQAKDNRSKLQAYRHYYSKDSIKAAKKAWNTYRKENKDSLKSIGRWDEAKAHKMELLRGKYVLKQPKAYKVEYADFPPPRDSLDAAIQELSRQGDFATVQQIYEAYGQYDSMNWIQYRPDSLALDEEYLMERFEMNERLQSYLPDELREESDRAVSEQLKYGEIDALGNLQKVDRSGVEDFISEVDPKEFAKSQIAMASAKKVFAEIPDLTKEQEGIKRQSLSSESFKDRLFLNGNVAIQALNPVALDVNTQLGYQINQKLSAGVGLLIRQQFGSVADSVQSAAGDSFGMSTFVNYDLWKSLFVYGEFQRVREGSLFKRESMVDALWEHAVLLGIGKQFQISSKISMSLLFLYDFNYRNNSLSQYPWQPRVGYRLVF